MAAPRAGTIPELFRKHSELQMQTFPANKVAQLTATTSTAAAITKCKPKTENKVDQVVDLACSVEGSDSPQLFPETSKGTKHYQQSPIEEWH